MRVVVLDDYQAVAAELADWPSESSWSVAFEHGRLGGDDAVVARLAGADAVVVMRERTPLPAAVLARLPRLRLIVTGGMRNAAIDLEQRRAAASRSAASRAHRRRPPSSPGPCCSPCCARCRTRTAPCARAAGRAPSARDSRGATLGLVGLGKLGRRMLPVARAFGMDVLAWSTNLTEQAAAQVGSVRCEKHELFRRSDVVSLHLVLSDRSRGTVGREELALLGPRGYLVNTARAGLVDRAALLDALHSRTIAGAALDVFDVEPLPADDPLLAAPTPCSAPIWATSRRTTSPTGTAAP